MANYPGSLDAFNNPTASTLENATGYAHHTQHSDANDAIEAIEATLGANVHKDSFGRTFGAGSLKARLDAQPRIFVQDTQPDSSVTQVGDLWYDTSGL